MDSTYIPEVRSENIVIQEIPASENGPAELLVYDLSTNRAHCLNETAALIWKHCNGNNTVGEIAGNLSGSGSEDLVWLGIDQLNKEDLLVEKYKRDTDVPSRREIIKKVGIASIIALPIISSLAAPTSVMAAASCICVAPVDCMTQTTCPSTTNCAATGICTP